MWKADILWSENILRQDAELWVKKRLWFLGRVLLLPERRLYLPWICGYSAHSYWWRQTCSHLSFSQGICIPHWNIFFTSVSLICHFLLKKDDLSSKKSATSKNTPEVLGWVPTQTHACTHTHTCTYMHTHAHTLKPSPVSWPESKTVTKDHKLTSPKWELPSIYGLWVSLFCGSSTLKI